jgi:hypothetical protein
MNLWDYSKNGLRGMVFFLSLRFVEIKSETWLRSIGTMLMGIIGPLDLEEIVKEDPLDSNQMAQWSLASCADVRSLPHCSNPHLVVLGIPPSKHMLSERIFNS